MDKLYDIIILTESRYLNPHPPDEYSKNVILEDQLVENALKRRGFRVGRKDWATPDFDWSATHSVLFRTTWDYFHRFDEFRNWLNKIKHITRCINPLELIEWNFDKHYLIDLKNKKVNIPPTHIIEPGNGKSLKDQLGEVNWNKIVLKPAISGAGRHTYLFEKKNWMNYESIFNELIATESLLLQEYQEDIINTGEKSLIFFGKKYSHSVIKRAKPGEFRVQDDFGGSVHEYNPTTSEIQFAEKAINACPLPPLYSRIDLTTGNDKGLAIVEIELIEPELWFRFNSKAADSLANTLFDYFNDGIFTN